MSANKFAGAGAAALSLLCALAQAQTVDELSDLNRQAMLAEAKAKLVKKPDSLQSGGQLATPPGALAGSATASPETQPVNRRTLAAKAPDAPPPVLVAIYGIGNSMVTELADGGMEAKYREGGKTPSGWTVTKIEKRLVTLARPGAKGKDPVKASLPFGIKLDEVETKRSEATMTPTGGLSMPPIPPNFPSMNR